MLLIWLFCKVLNPFWQSVADILINLKAVSTTYVAVEDSDCQDQTLQNVQSVLRTTLSASLYHILEQL